MSKSWLAHAKSYVDMISERFGIGSEQSVVEIASNDGYLLQYFVEREVPVLGVEPCGNVAQAARDIGVETVAEFFGTGFATQLVADRAKPDLVIGNNVLAHVPDLRDFVGGLKVLLAEGGVITMEFPHLARLIEFNQFDTIYHEHFSYFSLLAVQHVFSLHGLRIFDVEEIPTHGGSLRIFACHDDDGGKPDSEAVAGLLARERDAGLDALDVYQSFAQRVQKTKRELLKFLINAKEAGKTVVGYGAPAKGNTLLNFCGVRTDLLDYTVDVAPIKQGTLLPGVRIPVHAPDKILETRPDYVLILPWNIKEEIMTGMSAVREWGGQFLVPIPEVQLLD
jgi:SAM-dependent methyltransferase